MILTPEKFDKIRTIGQCLPQTVLGPGKSLAVAMVNIQDGDLLSIPWLCLHVTDLAGLVRYSDLTIASKTAGSPATVTTTEAFFEPADVERQKVKFLYAHRDQYWFSNENDPNKRFELKAEIIGELPENKRIYSRFR